jgi:predicted DNA-binding transcriptional regulator AlpA
MMMTTQPNDVTRNVLVPLLTVTDLERLLRVNKRTIRRLCQDGTLPLPLKLGQGLRWRADSITAALNSLERRSSGGDRQEERPAAVN